MAVVVASAIVPAASAAPAGAGAREGTGTPITLECRRFIGTLDSSPSTVTLDGCHGRGTDSGGSSLPMSTDAFAGPGTITFASGATMTIGPISPTGSHVLHNVALTRKCDARFGAGYQAWTFAGKVTASDVGVSPVPGRYHWRACLPGPGGTSSTFGSLGPWRAD